MDAFRLTAIIACETVSAAERTNLPLPRARCGPTQRKVLHGPVYTDVAA